MASQFKGVTLDARTNRWKAQIFIAGKNRNVGYFETEHEAARMWDTARVRLGEFFDHPVPKLNLGYGELLDPHAVLSLRERLEGEAAPKYNQAFLAEKPSAPAVETFDRDAENVEPVELRWERLCAEALQLNRRLAEILTELNEIRCDNHATQNRDPDTTLATGSQ